MAFPTLSATPAKPAPIALPRRIRRRQRWQVRWQALRGAGGLRIVAALLGGLGLYLGTAPRGWWWAAILGLGLLGAALNGRDGRAASGLSFLAGTTYFLPLLSWSGVYVGRIPWFGLALMEAALVIPGGLLIAVASRRLPAWPFFAAAAWVLGEALRARVPFGGFPWGGVAFTQPDGPLLPVAALFGSSGLAFCTALCGFGLAQLGLLLGSVLADRRRSSTGSAARAVGVAAVASVAALVAVAAPFALGMAGRSVMHDTRTDPALTVAVIQGNVPRLGLDFNAQRRAVLDNHAARTHELAAAVRAGAAPRPALVIWPENSSDIDPFRNGDAARVIADAAADIGVPVLVGSVVGTDQPGRNLNMGIVWDPVKGPGQTYTKRHPVPFGEYMPWRSFFRLFSDKVDLLRSEFLPGDRPGNLMVAGANLGDVICFEVVDDGIVRDVLAGGAQFLVVQTNNATFGYTNETWQQQAMSRVRAVEHGRDVLIAATSGVSAVIRSDGSVESTIGMFTPGYLTPSIGLANTRTLGSLVGGLLEWLLVAVTPAGLLAAAALRRRCDAADTTPLTVAGTSPDSSHAQEGTPSTHG